MVIMNIAWELSRRCVDGASSRASEVSECHADRSLELWSIHNPNKQMRRQTPASGGLFRPHSQGTPVWVHSWRPCFSGVFCEDLYVYHHTPPVSHPLSASFATLSFQGCQDGPTWPPTEPIRRGSGALAGGMPRFVFDGRAGLGSRMKEGLRRIAIPGEKGGRGSLLLFSPSGSCEASSAHRDCSSVRPMHAESGVASGPVPGSSQQQGTCLLAAWPRPGLGSEPMETARSRPALVVLDPPFHRGDYASAKGVASVDCWTLALEERTIARACVAFASNM